MPDKKTYIEEQNIGQQALMSDKYVDSLHATDMSEIVRLLIGIKDKINKCRNLKSNEKKIYYMHRVSVLIDDYRQYEITYDLLNRYLDVLDHTKRFSLAFRMREDEKEFCKRLDKYFSFLEAASIDFSGNGKWLRKIKTVFMLAMCCMALLIPPMLSTITNNKSMQASTASLIVCIAAFVTVSIVVGKQLDKRKKFSMTLTICFMPICTMVPLYWISVGFGLWGSVGAGMSEAIQSGKITGWDQIYIRIWTMGFPILGIVLLLLMITLGVLLYQNRKQFV